MTKKTFEFKKANYKATVNYVARQADGSVWFQYGDTVLLATATSAPAKEFPGFFPLTVEYREPFAAAGKIPGGFFKREGKSTDKEVLTSRIIDRAIRPFFPKEYFDSVQLCVTVYSVDKDHMPYVVAGIAASLALAISKIPFIEPVAMVEVARVDGQWVINPLYEQSLESDVKIVVAGTRDGICMVEGSTNEISEKEFLDALSLASETITEHVLWQEEIVQALKPHKDLPTCPVNWAMWEERSTAYLTDEILQPLFQTSTKEERNAAMDVLKTGFAELYEKEIEERGEPKSMVDYIFDDQLKTRVTDIICLHNRRVDGRAYDQIRPVSTEVGILPYTHGSSLFTRGATQALVTLTLGSGQDEQKVEDIMGGEVDGSFMLHYNFPPFSVGEVRPLRAPGRREVGHGYLAASAFKYVLPSKEDFPYTIRIVSDILTCDGSSSMATVCGSTMALLNGGVPVKDMVAGIAMGLLKSHKSDEFAVLTDISGFEDAFGLMDMKVAGTRNGMTAIQMDIKWKGGLPRSIFERAFEQARKARNTILDTMSQVMSKPNEKLSNLVPQVTMFKIKTDKIGAVIGTGGKVIREIIEKTGTSIDIEGDGIVKIFGQPGPDMERAVRWVKTLAGQIEPGTFYDGIVRKIAEFGLFVELVPGKEGLLHISAIPREHQRQLDKFYPVESPLRVKVMEYDSESDRIRLRLPE